MKQYERKGAKFCLNIKSDYVMLFKMLAHHMGSYELAIAYLIGKYSFRLLHLKHKIKKASRTIQPYNENYTRFSFWLREEAIWAQLEKMGEITGLSMSFVIRIMIEWEFYLEGREIVKETLNRAGVEYPEGIDLILFRVLEFWMWKTSNGIIIHRMDICTQINLL